MRREALVGGAVEPCSNAHRRVERVVAFLPAVRHKPIVEPPRTRRIFIVHDTLFSTSRHGRLERSFGGNFWRNDEASDGERRRLLIGGEDRLGRVRGSASRRHSGEARVRRLKPGLDHFERACQDGPGCSAKTKKNNPAFSKFSNETQLSKFSSKLQNSTFKFMFCSLES